MTKSITDIIFIILKIKEQIKSLWKAIGKLNTTKLKSGGGPTFTEIKFNKIKKKFSTCILELQNMSVEIKEALEVNTYLKWKKKNKNTNVKFYILKNVRRKKKVSEKKGTTSRTILLEMFFRKNCNGHIYFSILVDCIVTCLINAVVIDYIRWLLQLSKENKWQ